ncbi:hypothetical protein Moror_9562 [Moniliophthora roreri MCA 2997]|uniref:Uncharacterized protein n=1 Tax=Moniliophthora roreri (strain MCA 2997) TaxID=1381753 RepID=V2XE96_MONRO|nr:hypothetical protein Moror_9562 [Moniliophthora roreri MCA 2997]
MTGPQHHLLVWCFSKSLNTPLPGKQLDLPSIARMIWESNWESFTPSNEAYMNSFMMKPASTLEQVQEQLNEVKDRLHRSSEAENALLSAALSSLPRTCTLSKPVSGQPDISQMGLGRFCVEFLEFPGNRDLRPLEGDESQEALKTFMSPGSVITTKAAWSFTDSEDAAMKYSARRRARTWSCGMGDDSVRDGSVDRRR